MGTKVTKLEIELNSESQISSFMLDHMTPVQMRKDWDVELKKLFYVTPFIRVIDLIMDIGEIEHTSDWDPSVKVGYNDPDEPGEVEYFETESGYWKMEIQGDNILLEDAPGMGSQEDEDISYHVIPIKELRHLEIIRN